MQAQQSWRTFDGRRIHRNLKDEVQDILQQEQLNNRGTRLCIGTDSQVKGLVTEFATVIVFLREGRGGFMLISKERSARSFSIKERMMEEVNRSIAVAYALMEVAGALNVHMEIHVDINTDKAHKSNDALRDATGYLSGMGFQYKLKPYAFASSSCANKMVQ